MYSLYVITDEGLSLGRSHSELARLACEGGADAIQLRDKHMCKNELLAAAREVRRITSLHGALFFVNDHLDVAVASEADGVHLGQEDMRLADAVKASGRSLLIGISAATPEEALEAERGGADYVGVGPIFGTSSKDDAGEAVGTERIAAIRNVIKIPIVAIGGITKGNVTSVIAAGADGAAVISAVVSQNNVREAAAELKAIIDGAVRASKGRR
ncbi:MAG: thiamine phosphate synthase [Methanomassiliicoccaceae archaeon]|jgi:thiamine-phosphate pyrophosphorylase|nr:thiamine phosphate synthase [Methanomassiliicoccaceae archaeon]